MSVIKKISLKDAVGTATIYDIGSMAENVMYDEDSSVKDKLDNLNIRYLGSQLQVWDSVNEVWVNKIQLDDITYYVDGTNGSDTNAGTQASPFATIGKAIAMIGSDSFRSATAQIIVSDGTYTENVTIVGKNVSITGASGASSNVIIEGTLSASNFAKVYINKIRFNVSNYANVNAVAASNGAYIVAAGGVIIQGDGSNTGFYAFDNGNIKVANSDFVNMDCAFKADGGTIRVNNAPTFTTVATGALVTNGGVIHLRNDISTIAGVTTPYNKTNAYGGRIFVGSEDTMKGATSTTNGTGGTVPAPQAGDENKALFGDGTYKDVGHTILNESGAELFQRSKLQFEGAVVSDDETNDATIVDIDPTLRDAEVIEGKNKLKNPNSGVYSSGGITITTNADGSFLTSAGTPSANVNGYTFGEEGFLLKAGEYVYSGFPENTGLSASAAFMELKDTEWGQSIEIALLNSENLYQTFTLAQDTVLFARPYLRSGNALPAMTFYPMICTLEEWQKSHDYEPYYIPVKDAMFRREEQNLLGAKNWAIIEGNTETKNGITFTRNSDDSWTVNGTASASVGKEFGKQTRLKNGCTYTLSDGGVSESLVYSYVNGRTINNTWDYDIARMPNKKSFTVDYSKYKFYSLGIYAREGQVVSNKKFSIMLRLMSDPDETYVPPAKSNKELTDEMYHREEQALLSSKNLLRLNRDPGFSETKNGITFTYNSDGSITINGTNTYQVDGVNKGLAYGIIFSSKHLNQYGKHRYILSGTPIDMPNNNAYLYIHPGKSNNQWVEPFYNTPENNNRGNGVEFEYDGLTEVWCGLQIKAGATVNATFYPMIRLASDSDETFASYAMTNKELTDTEDITSKFTVVSGSGATINSNYSKVIRCGKTVYGTLRLTLPSTVSENLRIINVASEYLPALPTNDVLALCTLVKCWDGTVKGVLSANATGLILNSTNWVASANVIARFVYVIK